MQQQMQMFGGKYERMPRVPAPSSENLTTDDERGDTYQAITDSNRIADSNNDYYPVRQHSMPDYNERSHEFTKAYQTSESEMPRPKADKPLLLSAGVQV